MLTVHPILMSCLRAKQKTGVWTKFFCFHWPGIEPRRPAWQARILPLNHQSVVWWYTNSVFIEEFYFQFTFICSLVFRCLFGVLQGQYLLSLYLNYTRRGHYQRFGKTTKMKWNDAITYLEIEKRFLSIHL